MLKVLFLVIALAGPSVSMAKPDQVIVVRHAERSSEPKGDPTITPEGAKRAELLAEMLGAAKVQTVVTTNFRRTRETAAPLAMKLGLTPIVVEMRRGEVQAHIDDVVDKVEQAKGVVLVVGHTNTVSSIVEAFSDTRPTRLCESSFSNIFIATPDAPFLPAVHLKYGAPDPAPDPGCQ
jgi:phosphohistidine phosphatase SixA